MELLNLQQVLLLIPVSRSTFLRGVNDGRYPKSIRISKRRVAWKLDDVVKCIEEMK